ncbi:hypothetical protein ACFLV3_00010 [Chloroflexota bacterium]
MIAILASRRVIACRQTLLSIRYIGSELSKVIVADVIEFIALEHHGLAMKNLALGSENLTKQII